MAARSPMNGVISHAGGGRSHAGRERQADTAAAEHARLRRPAGNCSTTTMPATQRSILGNGMGIALTCPIVNLCEGFANMLRYRIRLLCVAGLLSIALATGCAAAEAYDPWPGLVQTS